MFIVYKGWGWLVVITGLATMLFAGVLGYRHPAIVWSAFALSGSLDHFIGNKLNRKDGRLLQDLETGEIHEVKQVHSFFWIPMQHWLWIKLALGFTLAVIGTNLRGGAEL